MKYKVGDKFIVEIEKVDYDIEKYPFRMSDNNWWSEKSLDKLQPCKEPVWRDGSVEPPVEHKRIYKLSEDRTHFSPMHPSHFLGYDWTGVYWLYVDEMPMPAMPKPHIELVPCPKCKSEVEVKWVSGYIECSVACSNCWYRIGMFETETEAIEAHNKLCGGLK